MQEQNSFKLLAEEEEKIHIPPPEVEEYIVSNLHVLSLLGKSLEVYIPVALNMFVEMLGGSSNLLESNGLPTLEQGSKPENIDEIAPSDS